MTDLLGDALVVAALGGCLASLGAVLSFLRLPARHRELRASGLARERALLARPLPPDDELPHVVVQIVCYNEGALVERSVENAAALDWPVDRLHVQVLDDSTDDTVDRAREAAARARAGGVDASVLHREDRRDFKAGALQEGVDRSPHDYFLVFDVDYVCGPDFLRRCMKPLLTEPELGFVQARLEMFNRSANLLTRAQHLILDYAYGLEQSLRSWSGRLVTFDGTGGVWRRAAVEAGGGWSGETVTEDLDLAYRAWLAGWKGTFLTSVTAEGEAPERVSTWTAQQRRWMSGIGEVALRMPRLIGERGEDGMSHWSSSSPLAFWVACVTVVGTMAAAAGAAVLAPSSAWIVALAVAVTLGAITAVLFALLRAASRFVRPGTPLRRFALDFVPVPGMILYMAWAGFRSIPKTVLRRRRIFARTPKSVPAP